MTTLPLTSTPSKILIDHTKQNETDAFLGRELEFPAVWKGNATPELMTRHDAIAGDKLVDRKDKALDLCMLEGDVKVPMLGINVGDMNFTLVHERFAAVCSHVRNTRSLMFAFSDWVSRENLCTVSPSDGGPCVCNGPWAV